MDNPLASFDIYQKIAQAQKLRETGNASFKAGDTKSALRNYYEALLHLRGLDQSILQQFPRPSQSYQKSGLTEVKDDDAKKIEDEQKDKKLDESKDPQVEEGEKVQSDIKKNMALVYTNMAACHIKDKNWQKALQFAQNATKEDPTNEKALFREAQARVEMGEVTRGRQILEELQKNKDDPAVRAALAKLNAEEKVRRSRDKAQFQGMFNRTKASTTASTSAPAVPTGPRFQEIVDEDTQS